MIYEIFLSALVSDEAVINHLKKQRRARDSQGLSKCSDHNESRVTLKNLAYC